MEHRVPSPDPGLPGRKDFRVSGRTGCPFELLRQGPPVCALLSGGHRHEGWDCSSSQCSAMHPPPHSRNCLWKEGETRGMSGADMTPCPSEFTTPRGPTGARLHLPQKHTPALWMGLDFNSSWQKPLRVSRRDFRDVPARKLDNGAPWPVSCRVRPWVVAEPTWALRFQHQGKADSMPPGTRGH